MRRRGIETWKWGVWAALAITLLSMYPQLVMWGVRGQEWNGSFAEGDADEWVYAAYVQALIDGRPRRNEPYTGRDDQPDRPQPESLFSIQFVPAYLIALPARVLGLSSSTAFIVLVILGPFFSTLAIFWLIQNATQDARVAAAGSVVVISFGALAAGQGLVQLLTSDQGYSCFLFLRRYEPLAPFPLFFLFCTFVWKALTAKLPTIAWAVAAGVTLGLLIFSYFYLWTSAAAWLACLALLWFIARRGNLRQAAGSFFTILLLAVAALVPYALLLSNRSHTMDSGQKLALSHAPDLFRIPEWIGVGTIALMIIGALRGRINWRTPESLFAASFCFLPLLVFNQQVVTGRSLQPFHYEVFIANYAALVGVALAPVIIWRGLDGEKRPASYAVLARVVFVAILWAVVEIVAPTKLIIRFSEYTDRAAAIGQRLGQLSKSDETFINSASGDTRPLVLASDYKVALILPVFAPQALLWESHFEFLNLESNETSDRFNTYLYYIGIDRAELSKELGQPMSNLAAAAFGHDRVIPDQSVMATPVTSEEIAKKVTDFEVYASSFSREKAREHVLSYVIVPADGSIDLSNLDRWYQRDQGERVGDHILYRVQLRP